MWNYPDSLVIFAAGNDGPYSGSIDAPSTNKNGIAVGASLNDYNSWILYGGGDSNTESSESGSTVYSGNSMGFFSSQGPTADGRMKPDIMAPGTYGVRVLVRVTAGHTFQFPSPLNLKPFPFSCRPSLPRPPLSLVLLLPSFLPLPHRMVDN
jgi:Subtilase family